MGGILWGVVVVVVALWLLGLVFRIAGNLIHLLLIVAVIVVIYNLITSQRNRA
ncbi:MAG TPA: lmo0937 family membrane protein [Thermomicrobiales bacterium]|jgi:predicted LPLAT superfamily acyltransferase